MRCSEGCIRATSAPSLVFVPVLLLFFSRPPLLLNKPAVTNDKVLQYDQQGCSRRGVLLQP